MIWYFFFAFSQIKLAMSRGNNSEITVCCGSVGRVPTPDSKSCTISEHVNYKFAYSAFFVLGLFQREERGGGHPHAMNFHLFHASY